MGEVGGGVAFEGAPVTVETLDPTEFARCWDLLVLSQRAAGWHPPPLFVLAELCARFGFGYPHPLDQLCTGEAEAYTCALARFSAPLLWQCSDLGPASVAAAHAQRRSVLLRRVVVADAVYPNGVARHRWRLTAECDVTGPDALGLHVSGLRWESSRPRLRWLGFSSVVAAQRWRPLPTAAGSNAPVDRFGTAAALCFSSGDTVVTFGRRPASLLSELVDTPFVSRYGPTTASEYSPPPT